VWMQQTGSAGPPLTSLRHGQQQQRMWGLCSPAGRRPRRRPAWGPLRSLAGLQEQQLGRG
jgi:hypothetical protein